MKKALNYIPLSLRGALIGAMSVFILLNFGIERSDLVAATLGSSLLLLILIFLICSYFLKHRLAKSMEAKAFFDNNEVFSNTAINSGIHLKSLSLPFSFSIYIRRIFNTPEVTSPEHLVRGSNPSKRLIDSVSFPHRGLWELKELNCLIQDPLRLTRQVINVPVHQNIELSARPLSIAPIPVIAASSRSGDLIQDQSERTGDLFDLKAYDPSDGVKRILWKTYAKSGELIVRHPEPAMLPDGEVAIYLIANKDEDHVAGAFRSYLNELDKNQITVLFGTDGNTEGIKSKLSEIENTINEVVWTPELGLGKDFSKYLGALQTSSHSARKIIVFSPEERDDWFETLTTTASATQKELSIVGVSKNLSEMKIETPNLSVALSKRSMELGLEYITCKEVVL